MAVSEVDDKTIVVTGANGRLGRVICRAFHGEGARLVGVVRTEETRHRLQSNTEMLSDVFVADMTLEHEVDSCFTAIEEQFETIDALIHTVGMWTETPFLDADLAQWQAVLDVNLTSAWLCFQRAVPLMDEGGRLIGFSSAQGADRGRSRQAAYGAAKAGLVRLVETAAGELEDRGITAHAIAPSFIRFGESDDSSEGIDASEIAALCLYLCGSGGAAVNGATIRTYGSNV
jgi:NAD(P)-dependent dehydrogenase (short-subunit alcohol dehydrogenase family)